MKCGKCKWWEDSKKIGLEESEYGECKRYPPSAIQGPAMTEEEKEEVQYEEKIMGVSPLTETDDWCGEFERKKTEQEIEGEASIKVLHLSPRAVNCLMSVKIDTITSLQDAEDRLLLKIRSFGKRTLREVKYKLNEYLKK